MLLTLALELDDKRNTGEFMMSRYKEVADIVFKYRDHRNPLVRQSITALLPRIAHFLRDRFVSSYLQVSQDKEVWEVPLKLMDYLDLVWQAIRGSMLSCPLGIAVFYVILWGVFLLHVPRISFSGWSTQLVISSCYFCSVNSLPWCYLYRSAWIIF